MKAKMKSIISYAIIGLAFSLLLFSCSKKDVKDTAQDQTTAVTLTSASSVSQGAYDDVFNQVSIEAESNNISGREMTETGTLGCAAVTLSPNDATTFPKTMTIDFGTGCTLNGVTRKGKVVAVFIGKLRTPGTTVSISFENYYVNDFKLEGTLTITNNTTNNVLSFTTQTTNGKLIYPGGILTYTHTGSHTYTLIGGGSTPTFLDDSWSVSGSGTTTSSNNESLAVNIKTPLIKNVECGSVVSGVEDFKYNNLSGSLDFGAGTCDRQATLTIGAYTTNINF